MALGDVTARSINFGQTKVEHPERHFLYLGFDETLEKEYKNKLTLVDNTTDFSKIFQKDSNSCLQTTLKTARNNAKNSWQASFLALSKNAISKESIKIEINQFESFLTDKKPKQGSTDLALDSSSEKKTDLQKDLKTKQITNQNPTNPIDKKDILKAIIIKLAKENKDFEAICLTDYIEKKDELINLQSLNEFLNLNYDKYFFFITHIKAIDNNSKSWDEYITNLKSIAPNEESGEILPTVMALPNFFGFELGALAGRLCKKTVTIADSPMRVETGALVGDFEKTPKDKNGSPLDNSILTQIDALKFSVPQQYSGKIGWYWADGNTFDKTGGDFAVIENLRVVQKLLRRVYLLGVDVIANRDFNSSLSSIKKYEAYFQTPHYKMSERKTILGVEFIGECYEPSSEDIALKWTDQSTVAIALAIRPYNSAKKIHLAVALRLN